MHFVAGIGKQLSTRIDGAVVREKIARGIEENQWIVLDFDEVEMVSNSTRRGHSALQHQSPLVAGIAS